MIFMIHATYVEDHADLWSRYMKAHVDYLRDNVAVVLAAGGLLDDQGTQTQGALYVIEAESRKHAQEFIEADPFMSGGLFETVSITRWRKSFFNFEHVGGPGHAGVGAVAATGEDVADVAKIAPDGSPETA